MFLKLTHFLIFQFCKIITRYKKIPDINYFDFNTFPSSKIELKKHVENGIFRNSNFNKNIQELKIRGNEKVILSISSFSWLFLFSALNFIYTTSEPEPTSDIAKEPTFLPEIKSGKYCSFCKWFPHRNI